MTDGAPTDTLGEATKLRRERGHREKAASQWIEKELWSERGASYRTGIQKASPQGQRTARGHLTSILCNQGPKAKLLTFYLKIILVELLSWQ